MSEAIIAKRNKGDSSGSGGSGTAIYNVEYITENAVWTMPSNIINNSIYVWIFGGGGGGWAANTNDMYNGYGTGGGGGWMNNSQLIITPGTRISIQLGEGGRSRGIYGNSSVSSGGTTSFGSYLSANGGDAGSMTSGGNGGSGGGGGGRWNAKGGRGYQFGGGGGWNDAGQGGPWGGNGGTRNKYGENGINTSTWTNLIGNDPGGWGISGDYLVGHDVIGFGAGGGGFGGNGGKGFATYYPKSCGGGGGYGGDGERGWQAGSGGGGGYSGTLYGNWASGGNSRYGGKNGICIISYYQRG